jgi:hypothetical protein
MWVAAGLPDSTLRIWKSSDHGTTWSYFSGGRTTPGSVFGRIGLVVGEGDSNFVHAFVLHPSNSGDMYEMRFEHDGSALTLFPVQIGPDTLEDFSVCRDYSGGNYWVYASAFTTHRDDLKNGFMLRTTQYGRDWAVTDTFDNLYGTSYSAGAGSYLYFATAPYSFPGELDILVNTLYGARGFWRLTHFNPGGIAKLYPKIAAAFTRPESTAVFWCTYTERTTSDDNILYLYSTDGGNSWSYYWLIADPSVYEINNDLANYHSPGNQYVNELYTVIDTATSYRYLIRQWVGADDPTNWHTSERLQLSSGWITGDRSTSPLLVYSPGSSGTGAGAVFARYDSTNGSVRDIAWNSPWNSVEEPQHAAKRSAAGLTLSPTITRQAVRLEWSGQAGYLTVSDVGGRLVRRFDRPRGNSLTWDRTDARGARVPVGTYVTRLDAGGQLVEQKLVVLP